MAGSIRCPHCGGLNPAGAEWCGQCLARFTPRTAPRTAPPPPPAPESPPSPEAPASEATSPRDSAAPEAAGAPGSGVTPRRSGAFTVTEEGITWTCTRCDNDNPLEAAACLVCGTSFADNLRPPVERVERDPNTVALYSLFFPGAGHWYLDLKGQAVARAILSAWVVMVVLIAGLGGSTGMAALFGIVAFVLWALAAHDAFREARHEAGQVILKPRLFVYVVLGLLTLMGVMLVSAGMRVAS